ncbi:MAG: fasciclin domain-containing protein [Candidatus Competibacteraceae bacterium]|nr:fasciclin domain-containing protein [Candidatus Competibacteraceae bacterium]
MPAFIMSALIIGISGSAVAGSHGKQADSKDIVDTAVAAGNFTTLVQAVQAAELVETLKGEGPFTVFAPTDEAFAKIPADQLQALLADKAALTEVLTYHVVPGKVMAADVVKLESAETAQGQSITIDASDGVKVDNATVVQTDIETSNGVIHVIDTVLLPKS